MMDWFSTISTWLVNLPQDTESLQNILIALITLAVLGAIMAAYFLITSLLDPMRKRVNQIANPTQSSTAAPPSQQHSQAAIAALGNLLAPKGLAKKKKTADILRYAGFRGENADRVFYGIKLMVIGLIPLAIFSVLVLSLAKPFEEILLYTAAAAALCYLLPDYVLLRLARQRQDQLRRGLPDAMDLLVVCSEAGLGLNASIQRVATELVINYPELADELGEYSLQTRAGMDSESALKDLQSRTGLDDIQGLVSTLLQGMQFGTSIGETLRIYSEELRDKRLQRAQEKAARVGTLVIFPLITCILPSFLLVVLGPPILGAIAAFSAMGR